MIQFQRLVLIISWLGHQSRLGLMVSWTGVWYVRLSQVPGCGRLSPLLYLNYWLPRSFDDFDVLIRLLSFFHYVCTPLGCRVLMVTVLPIIRTHPFVLPPKLPPATRTFDLLSNETLWLVKLKYYKLIRDGSGYFTFTAWWFLVEGQFYDGDDYRIKRKWFKKMPLILTFFPPNSEIL